MKKGRLLKRLVLILTFFIAVSIVIYIKTRPTLVASVNIDNHTINSQKLLKISFNKKISVDATTKHGITIRDSKNNYSEVTFDLGKDKKSILINPPIGGYISGEKYTLSISSDVHSDNLKLSKNIDTEFSIDKKSISNPIKINREAKYGDIVGIHYDFYGYPYEHYGIYIGNNKVIHYASSDGTMRNAEIVTGDMDKNFPKGKYFVMDLDNTEKFSADKTVKRAESRIGEKNYNLLTNNCEHFAVWCKTDKSKSYQIDSLNQSQLSLIKQYLATGIIPDRARD